MRNKLSKLFDVKSIVTLLMTVSMILLLTGIFNPPSEVFSLFATTYGAVITYFFTKKKNAEGE